MAAQPRSIASPTTQPRRRPFGRYIRQAWPLYAMLLPGLIVLAVFSYYPMYGVIVAFQRFNPGLGFSRSPWVGWANFQMLWMLPDLWPIVRNTVLIALGKIVTVQFFAVGFALLLNEVRSTFYKRSVQTLVYLPYFLSWIVLGGILLDMLGTNGIVNRGLGMVGVEPIVFLGDNDLFQPTILITNLWKEGGWAAIIYLAALTGIDPQLYEAAAIDGASRARQTWHITLPGIRATIVLIACLALGSTLNAGFEQILALYNPVVYPTGDILDTYVYRAGLLSAQYGLATAVGLCKSIVGLVLVLLSFQLIRRFTDFRVF